MLTYKLLICAAEEEEKKKKNNLLFLSTSLIPPLPTLFWQGQAKVLPRMWLHLENKSSSLLFFFFLFLSLSVFSLRWTSLRTLSVSYFDRSNNLQVARLFVQLNVHFLNPRSPRDVSTHTHNLVFGPQSTLRERKKCPLCESVGGCVLSRLFSWRWPLPPTLVHFLTANGSVTVTTRR